MRGRRRALLCSISIPRTRSITRYLVTSERMGVPKLQRHSSRTPSSPAAITKRLVALQSYHIKEHVTSKTNPQQSLTNHHSTPRKEGGLHPCAEPPRGQFLAIFGIREAFLKIYAQKGYNEPIAGGLWHFKAPIVRGEKPTRTTHRSEFGAVPIYIILTRSHHEASPSEEDAGTRGGAHCQTGVLACHRLGWGQGLETERHLKLDPETLPQKKETHI